jgi:hypothetical protein
MFIFSYQDIITQAWKMLTLHCKNFAIFPSRAGMSLTKLSLAGNNLIIFLTLCCVGCGEGRDEQRAAGLRWEPDLRNQLCTLHHRGRNQRGTGRHLKLCRMMTYTVPHCKDTTPKIRNKYSRERNCTATVPIPMLLQENRWAECGNIVTDTDTRM